MPRTLIAYSTVDGQTLRISARLKQVLERAGHAVQLLEIANGSSADLSSFDQAVIGASIRYGKYRPDLYRFVETHREALDRIPGAFFSVNVVARKVGKDTPESNPYVQAFRRRTTWAPREIGVFAGRLDYPAYGFVDRQVIRLIMWLTKGPTDPKTCVEFTNWQEVESFARRVSRMSLARGSARPHPDADAASEA